MSSCSIHAVSTIGGQEYNVALLLKLRAEAGKLPIYSIVVTNLKGLIFVESAGPHVVDLAGRGVKHFKGRMRGKVDVDELVSMVFRRPSYEEFNVGDTVEIVAGPLKGHRARVVSVDASKRTIRVELLDATIPLPLDLRIDDVKKVKR